MAKVKDNPEIEKYRKASAEMMEKGPKMKKVMSRIVMKTSHKMPQKKGK